METGLRWDGFCDGTASELLSGSGPSATRAEQAERLPPGLLAGGKMPSDVLLTRASTLGISERTLKIARQKLGVTATRRGDR